MNAWLTWKARLHHALFPDVACQCYVCAADRRAVAAAAARAALLKQQVVSSNKVIGVPEDD